MAVDGEQADPMIRQLRERISDNDRGLVQALNRRLELVSQLKRYKESRGLVIGPEREEWIVRDLSRANRGPLSRDGLDQICTAILELTKREIVATGESASDRYAGEGASDNLALACPPRDSGAREAHRSQKWEGVRMPAVREDDARLPIALESLALRSRRARSPGPARASASSSPPSATGRSRAATPYQ
jgi:chorismate mutase